MPGNNPERTTVFISYSHQDSQWLKRLRVHLKPLARRYPIDIWDDTRIESGSKWNAEIEQAIRSARLAVLLVSADFLASDFITDNELPLLLKAAEEDGATILPVILSPCGFQRTPTLSKFQTVNDVSKPLTGLPASEQESVFEKVANTIERLLESLNSDGSRREPNAIEEPVSEELVDRIVELLIREMAWAMYVRRYRTMALGDLLQLDQVSEQVGRMLSPDCARSIERVLSNSKIIISMGNGRYCFKNEKAENYLIARKMAEALDKFPSDPANTITVWRERRLMPSICDLLVAMVDKDALWQLIERTKGKDEEEVKYAGGNAATVLCAKKSDYFKGRDLSGMLLRGATLFGSNLRGAVLRECNLSDADLGNVDFEDAIIDSDTVNVSETNVRGVMPKEKLDLLLRAGGYEDRYSGSFGNYFAKQQADLFKGDYTQALNQYLRMIQRVLTKDSRVLDIMSGAGDITETLLKEYPELDIVVTDRSKAMLDRIEEAGHFPNLKHVRCELPERADLIKPEKNYTVITCKKGLHEIAFDQQENFLRQVADWLSPGGRIFFWLDGAAYTAPKARQNILNARGMTRLKDVLTISIEQTEDGVSEFINLWAFVKDWYCENKHERDNRYFISKEELIECLEKLGLIVVSPQYEYAYRLNPVNLNEKAKRAELEGDQVKLQDALEDNSFQIFCDFTEKHLFKGKERTPLGKLLSAKHIDLKGRRVVEFSFPFTLIEAKKKRQ